MSQIGERTTIAKKCLVVRQGGWEFFVFVINSRDLREISQVSRRDTENPQGYQRYLSESRLKQVGNYIKKATATFPNNIIINLDSDKAEFTLEPDGQSGIITIHKEEDAAWIIDGQHRVGGFRYSDGKEFDLIVAAFIGLPISVQAGTFIIINSEQKGVNISLIYDLIDVTRDADFTTMRLHDIIKHLNEDDDSPWKGIIKMIGTGPGIITQAGMVRELKKIIFHPLIDSGSVTDQIKIFKDYFGAIKELFPDAWADNKHILCKTLGLGAFINIMNHVLYYCAIKNSLTKDTMKEALVGLREAKIVQKVGAAEEPLDFSSKQFRGWTGTQGQVLLAEILKNHLPPIQPSRQE